MDPSAQYPATRLQRQIEHDLQDYIREHGLVAGDRLPSQHQLAEQLQVSPAALREALARLSNQGVIRLAHGIGTFVADEPRRVHSSAAVNWSLSELIRAEGMQPGTRQRWLAREPLPEEFQDFLRPAADGQVLCLRRVRTADGAPFAYAVAYFSPDLVGLSDDPAAYAGSLYEYLRDRCGVEITEADAEIAAFTAGPQIGAWLETAENTPLLTLIQRHRSAAGQAVFASLEYILQSRLKMKIQRRRSPN